MKVLWISNVIFPELGERLNRDYSNSGGWMNQFKKSISGSDEYTLAITSFDHTINTLIEEKIENIQYYLIPKKAIIKYDKKIEYYIEKILRLYNPNLVHIWGTEYPHSYAVLKICNKLKIKSVISIQGLINDYAKHYTMGLSIKNIYSYTLRDLIKNDNIKMQQKNFYNRGIYEIKCINESQNVIGRTIYDYSGVKEINQNINYYFCNECLRDSFYSIKKWNIDEKEKFSIFISQANYPIKGFHYFLDALVIIKRIFPNVKVYVAGGFNPFETNKLDKIKQNGYSKLILKKIKKFDLKNNIFFLGNLTEKEMSNQIRRVHVFVSPSLVENSPNSVGEAMLIGVPVISSFVGGISDMIEHNHSGLLYPFDQPNILAEYVIKIFKDNELAQFLSNNAIKRAKSIYDIKINTNQMKKIYEKIVY